MLDLPHILLAISGLLIVVSAIQPLARHLVISDAVLLAVVGVAIGVGATVVMETNHHTPLDHVASTLLAIPVDSEAFLFVFLPLLVFHGGLSIDVRGMVHDAAPILLLAVVAVFLTTAAIGFALCPFAPVPLIVCLMVGAIVATTDPSAVVGVFREIGADARLTRLVEGEALLNDAAAISLFTMLMTTLVRHQVPSVMGAASSFVLAFMGGLLVGYGFARIMLAAIPRLNGIIAAEVTLTLALPYLAYIVGDEFLHVSGVVAASVAGLTVSSIGPSTFRPQSWSFLQDIWKQISFWASSMVFILASMLVPRLMIGVTRSDLLLVAIVVAAAMAARALVLFGLLPALATLKLSQRVPAKFQVTILWGGLRGAITLALALSVTENSFISTDVKRMVAILATSFALITLLVNGTTLRYLVTWLGLDRLSPVDQALRNQVVAIGLQDVRDAIEERGQDYGFSPQSVDHVLRIYNRRIAEETAANTFDTAITDRERVLIGLLTFASQEKATLLEMFKDRAISRHVMENLLRAAESMVDGVRSDGRLGYIRAARRRLRPTLKFRVAQWMHKHLRINKPLMYRMMERYEILLLSYLVYLTMMRFMKRRMEPVLGERVAEIVSEIVGRRRELLSEALDTLRVQYPGYAEALETRMLRQIALRLEANEYAELHRESLIGEELYEELQRDLEARRDRLSQPLRFNLQTGMDNRIREFPLLSELQPAVLHDLSMNFSMRFPVPGEAVFKRGAVARSVFFISSGTVELVDGNHVITLGAGDFFGEDEVLKGGRRHATARSRSFGQLLELKADVFRDLVAEQPDLQSLIERIVSSRHPRSIVEEPQIVEEKARHDITGQPLISFDRKRLAEKGQPAKASAPYPAAE
ncbi:Na+/H+ antiporter nhaP [Granulibacter bethesdensis]|uniref:cation:proton antiporter n=1 Tax=Granulibacter bethesdensis TaxID=364410 RepID=UPI000909A803|nr:cation:proton antiporter [Granulibacter bethesdensis]APH56245.1 Na+/H+ antiporter nhaP [Granulibacter bethesdensis]